MNIERNSTARDYYREKHDIEWAMFEEDQKFDAWLETLSDEECQRVLFGMQRQARINTVVWSRTARIMNQRYARVHRTIGNLVLKRMAGKATKDDYQRYLKLSQLWNAKRNALQMAFRQRIETRTLNAMAQRSAGVVATPASVEVQ